MNKTTSLDGTTPAIDSTAARTGPHHRGGRSVLRSAIQKGMAVLLADRFTVHEYDRCGRRRRIPQGRSLRATSHSCPVTGGRHWTRASELLAFRRFRLRF